MFLWVNKSETTWDPVLYRLSLKIHLFCTLIMSLWTTVTLKACYIRLQIKQKLNKSTPYDNEFCSPKKIEIVFSFCLISPTYK